MKCDWCGEHGIEGYTGQVISESGKELRTGQICHREGKRHTGNPVFVNNNAWIRWAKIHPKLANRIKQPKIQYSKLGGDSPW